MTAETYVDPPTVEQPGWLTPGEITIDAAMIHLGDAGFHVSTYPGSLPCVVAERGHGDRYAHVVIVEGSYQVVTHQLADEDGNRSVVKGLWPDSVADAVARAVELAGELKQAHDAEQQPAVFGDEIQAAHDAQMTQAGAA